jgi:hypothetical protein
MLAAAGVTSTGGLATFAVKRFFFQPDRNHQTNETRQNENRDIGNKNRQKRSESFQSCVRS